MTVFGGIQNSNIRVINRILFQTTDQIEKRSLQINININSPVIAVFVEFFRDFTEPGIIESIY